MDTYSPSEVEAKWQSRWDELGTNLFSRDDLANAEKPYFNLMMFPYPSAEGLHVGNIYAYTGADVWGRYQRLKGHDVFQPMGFDAFGIHSENYALKVGVNPNDLIPSNISNFTRQLRRIGAMFDWNHTVDTTDPNYYRWTQWVFLKLFEAGLVEKREAPVNWCPSCKTVVANEQVIQGLCERCDSAVEQRQFEQWFLKITNYAQRLLDGIEHIDWSSRTLSAQNNWIGRSEGADIDFPIVGRDESIQVFTTRPDTICGATYMVLAPEHPLVDKLTNDEHRESVDSYVEQAKRLDLKARQYVDRPKTGTWIGAYCENPITGAQMPVWVSDYVLIEYGTGAIMAVPGHDERDFEFANTFDLPIKRVIARDGLNGGDPLTEAYVGDGVLVNSGEFDGLTVAEGKRAIVQKLEANELATGQVRYRLHDWCISRQRYWGPPIPIVYCDECGAVPVPETDLPVLLPRLEQFKPDDSGESPLARDTEWCSTECPKCGGAGTRETDVSDTFLDSAWYFLRYPCTDADDVALDEDMVKKWLPVDSYIGGHEHAVLHLLYARFVTMAFHDHGILEFGEPFEKFRAHGILSKDGRKISKSRGNVIIPDDLIAEWGADTVRLYLMFLGPFEQGGDYQSSGIRGPSSFLDRLTLSVSEASDGNGDAQVLQAMHRTIDKVSNDIEQLKYNTVISALMEYLNVVREGGRTCTKQELEPIVVMLAPFAPHLAEELWERLGHNSSIFESGQWPEADPELAKVETFDIGVQVNGKLRGSIGVTQATSEEEAMSLARSNERVAAHLNAGEVRKVIYVPGRILNVVVK